ncbi:hypothetical protein D3C87_1096720 [compost metagenome]
MSDIRVDLSRGQCDLIALALDLLMSKGSLSKEDHAVANELFCQFDTLSDPVEEPIRSIPKVAKLQLVYDRDSNVRPLFRR